MHINVNAISSINFVYNLVSCLQTEFPELCWVFGASECISIRHAPIDIY